MTKILIIEDDHSMRSLLKTLLEIENFQVSVLDINGGDLIAQIISADPDVILMDVNLKSTDGLTILREMRGNTSQKKNYRVIMTSGEDRKQECLLAGANDFLLKPYMPADLIQKLKLYS
ncbi:response regulator transcription factor [Bellilinea sp.]|jgi:DNA-binding response OmpR family regulator|uniref:response regulator transcription factor n=1 Tax=Bellilinea sp. TaxID=2838785 RepID=UPI002ADDF2B0|nr:response regulator [Bellilinea sp.]